LQDLVSYYIERVEPLWLTKIGDLSGEDYGATLIDRTFLEWLGDKIENFSIRPEDYARGGHFVLDKKGTLLLRRFEPLKRKFSGTEDNYLQLPREMQLRQQETEEEEGEEEEDGDDDESSEASASDNSRIFISA
jgi:hypothetical protein